MNERYLKQKANQMRRDIITMLAVAGSGHTAGPLDLADIFTALYFGPVINFRPKQPNWPERDRVILSCGHTNPVYYATLAHAGYFPVTELKTLRKFGSRLQGHPDRLLLPGLETSSGPLGQGLSQAIGMALAGRLDKAKYQIFAILSDGEHDEGQTWEAIMLAAKYKLDNLTVIVDRNNMQIDGSTENVMPLDSLAEKYRAFNWHVIEVDGHNISGIIDACDEAKAINEQPVAIIAYTIPGKGVSFMEGDYRWHGKVPTAEEAKLALKELGK